MAISLLLVFPEFMLPTHDFSRIPLFFGLFDLALGLIEHRQTRMGQDILLVDIYESFSGSDCLVKPVRAEKCHTQAMQGVLVCGIHLQSLLVQHNGFIQFVIAEGIHGLFKAIFLGHDEIIASWGRIPSSMANFQAIPQTSGQHPGLIVIQEFWGVNDHIKDVTQRIASEGFVALAVDLYNGSIARDPQEARQMLQSLDQDASVGKLNAGIDALKANPQVAIGKIGVIGFCMGGLYALLLASQNKDVRAVASFYGRIPPNETLERITAPTLCIYAGKDDHIPVSEPNRAGDVLRKKDVPVEVKIYEDAHHAFMNDTREEVYKADDAKDAWNRAIEFFKKHLA